MRRVTVVGTHGRASVPVKTLTPFRFDTTDARPSVPTTVTRRLVRQRTLDRASLQPLLVDWFDNGRSTERPYFNFAE